MFEAAESAISTVKNLPKLPRCVDSTRFISGPGDGLLLTASFHAGTRCDDVAKAAPSIKMGGAAKRSAIHEMINKSHEDRSRW